MSFSLFNPWVLLGLLAAFLAVGGGGYENGKTNGSTSVQARWDAAEKQRAWESQRNTERVRDAETYLQEKADAKRKADAVVLAGLNARVERLNGELLKRASRPAASTTGVTASTGLGATGSTGLGLYREDSMFLLGEAATARRIQLQRDSCYSAYGEAQAALKALAAQAIGK